MLGIKQFQTINRCKLKEALADEVARFELNHRRSIDMFEQAKTSMAGGVPMHWMVRWAGSSPVFVERAQGATLIDVDGNEYADLCLGDTGAMAGHSPEPVVRALTAQLSKGLTLMMPSEDAIWVSKELQRRFKLPFWQFALTATDANRFSIRIARKVTNKPRIICFSYCYHGTVDETFVILKDGKACARKSNLGPPVDPSVTTRVVEFNDLPALEAALSEGDIACVLAEPVMTNIGIIHPEAGFWKEASRMIKNAGALLIIDETHTMSAGPSGYAVATGMSPDILTVGKAIAGGVPSAAYGMTSEVAKGLSDALSVDDSDVAGIGGTLAANALSMVATRATLEHILTEEMYETTIALASRFADGVRNTIERYELPWTVQSLGCRAEYWFCPKPPKNGTTAAALSDPELERYMHLAALNRGVVLTPFHNMALVCPATTATQIDLHTAAFAESVRALIS